MGPRPWKILPLLLLAPGLQAAALPLFPHPLALAQGRSVTLNLPEGWEVTLAAEGLRRPRFMALSPDGRLFIGGLYNMDDTQLGRVYALEKFNPKSGRFGKSSSYLSRLRNPNSLAFLTEFNGRHWIYVAETHRLTRYSYHEGDDGPMAQPQVLAEFPAYGLNYKYGGWHLTRTLALGGNGKLYVSVGSSCNACEEKKHETRACVLEMNPDGSAGRVYARGLRNSVGMRWVGDRLVVTDMGADHLGDDLPLEGVYELKAGAHYGWPYCYRSPEGMRPDPQFDATRPQGLCEAVPEPYWTHGAHGAPLGLEYFGEEGPRDLKNRFLVAFHGSGKKSLGRGYRVVRMKKGEDESDFVTGFWKDGKVYGRPVDILKAPAGGFFLTDDFNGVVYWIRPSYRP